MAVGRGSLPVGGTESLGLQYDIPRQLSIGSSIQQYGSPKDSTNTQDFRDGQNSAPFDRRHNGQERSVLSPEMENMLAERERQHADRERQHARDQGYDYGM